MKIRKAIETDIPAIVKIYDKIHEAEHLGKMCIGWQEGVYPVADTAKNALAANELFTALDEGKIVGSVILNQKQVDCYAQGNWLYPAADDEVMVMHTLAIDPDRTGKGYGSRVAAFYENYAREHGCKVLRIDTQEKNLAARAMYRKLGYHEAGKLPCIFNGIPDVSLVLIEKLL